MTLFTSGGESQRFVRVREAVIVEIVARRPDFTEAMAKVQDSGVERVISYHALTGPVAVGDRVTLNTTAVELKLGTGGVHFVMAVHGRSQDAPGPGHIMKLRYTPSQLKVLSVEEERSPHHAGLKSIPDLAGTPVLIGTLHSQVPIVAAVLRSNRPHAKVVYVMTDGAALPAAFSRLVHQMKAHGIIDTVITAGHAFGGDLEAVNVPSAMAAAYVVAQADAIIVAMGPGVVGTGTPLGTTALEQGPILDAARAIGATPIPIVRASQRDGRGRHLGISHHTLTVLTRFTFQPMSVPLTWAPTEALTQLLQDQTGVLADAGHDVVWQDGRKAYEQAARLLKAHEIEVTSMGRGADDDPLFFWMAAAAGEFSLRWIRRTGESPG